MLQNNTLLCSEHVYCDEISKHLTEPMLLGCCADPCYIQSLHSSSWGKRSSMHLMQLKLSLTTTVERCLSELQLSEYVG